MNLPKRRFRPFAEHH